MFFVQLMARPAVRAAESTAARHPARRQYRIAGPGGQQNARKVGKGRRQNGTDTEQADAQYDARNVPVRWPGRKGTVSSIARSIRRTGAPQRFFSRRRHWIPVRMSARSSPAGMPPSRITTFRKKKKPRCRACSRRWPMLRTPMVRNSGNARRHMRADGVRPQSTPREARACGSASRIPHQPRQAHSCPCPA